MIIDVHIVKMKVKQTFVLRADQSIDEMTLSSSSDLRPTPI